MPSLAFIVLVPFAGAILARVIPMRDARLLRGLGIGCTLLSLAGMLCAMRTFVPSRKGFQLETDWAWIASVGARFHLGIDGVAYWFALLALVIILVALLSLQTQVLAPELLRKHLAALLAIASGTLGVLVALDMHTFFVFWELTTVAMFLVVVPVTEGNRRRLLLKGLALVQAIAMLGVLAILYRSVHRVTGTWSFDYTTWCSIVLPQSSQLVGLGLLCIALLAPLAMVATGMRESRAWPGSSLLFIAILIELFAFGLLRYGLAFFPLAWQQTAPLFAGLAVAGIVIGSLLANRQGEPELWAGRAWVAQLGFVVLGMVTATPQSVLGAVSQTLAQGLSCAGLYLTITALQKRGPVEQLGGLKPYLIVVFLAASGLPGLCGFVGEFLIILGGWRARGQWDEMQLAPLYMRADIVAVIVALAALAYAVGFVRMLAHLASGRGGSGLGQSHQLTWGERVAFPVVLAAMIGVGLLPGRILKQLSYPVASVLLSAKARAVDARSHAADPAHRFEPPAARAAGDLLRAFD